MENKNVWNHQRVNIAMESSSPFLDDFSWFPTKNKNADAFPLINISIYRKFSLNNKFKDEFSIKTQSYRWFSD